MEEMEEEEIFEDTPYMKLAKTPLAQKTKICCVPVRLLSYLVALHSLCVIAGSYFFFGHLAFERSQNLWDSQRPAPDNHDAVTHVPDSSRGHTRGHNPVSHNNNSAALEEESSHYIRPFISGIIFSTVGLVMAVSSLTLVWSIYYTKPLHFRTWFLAMPFSMIFGRVVAPLIDMKVLYLGIDWMWQWTLVDVCTIFVVYLGWGLLLGEARNKRYRQPGAGFWVKPNAQGELLSKRRMSYV